MINLERIRRNILADSEDTRFYSWMELYCSETDAALHEIDAIMGGGDTTLKIRFLKFLARIEELRAVRYITRLMQESDGALVDIAIRSFDKNSYMRKLDCLLPLIKGPTFAVQCYAIDKLAMGGIYEALDPILRLLNTSQRELIKVLLRALRFLPDKRIVPYLSRCMNHTDHEIRHLALLVYISLFENGVRGMRTILIEFLRDRDAQVRQTAIWGLKKKPLTKGLNQILKMSIDDSNEEVRGECISYLAYFPSAPVVTHLLRQLTYEREKNVQLKCEAALLNMPMAFMAIYTRVIFDFQDQSLYRQAVLFFAEYHAGSDRFARDLLRRLKRARGVQLQTLFIEALGHVGHICSLEVLRTYLRAETVIAYVAMNALLKILAQLPQFPLYEFVSDPLLSALQKQTLLRFVISRKLNIEYDNRLIDALKGFLQSTNLNLSYLSAQVLLNSHERSMVEPVFFLMLQSKDGYLEEYWRQCLLVVLQDHDELMKVLFQTFHASTRAITCLFEFLSLLQLPQPHLKEFIVFLLNPPYQSFADNYLSSLVAHLRSQLYLEQITLGDILDMLEQSPFKRELIIEFCASLTESKRFPLNAPMERLEAWLEQEDFVVRDAVIKLLGLINNRRPLPFLVQKLCDDSWSRCHQRIKRSLDSLFHD